MLTEPEPTAPAGLTTSQDSDLAVCLAFLAEIDPDLAEIVEAWPGLPADVQAEILALQRGLSGDSMV